RRRRRETVREEWTHLTYHSKIDRARRTPRTPIRCIGGTDIPVWASSRTDRNVCATDSDDALVAQQATRLPPMRTPTLASPSCDIHVSIQSALHRAPARVYKTALRFYESPSPVQRELKILRPVVVPFFYPSIGSCLAPMGCFEKVRTAPSLDELLAPA